MMFKLFHKHHINDTGTPYSPTQRQTKQKIHDILNDRQLTINNFGERKKVEAGRERERSNQRETWGHS